MINAMHGLFGKSKLICDELPNVLSAFSFRKVRNDYTGAAFRVRRATDSATADIGFVGGYADTATLITFLSGTTGVMTIWYDQIKSSNLLENVAPQLLIATVSGQSRVVARFTGSQYLTGNISGVAFPTSQDLALNTVTANSSGNSSSSIAAFGDYLLGQLRANYIISNKYNSAGGGNPSNIDSTVSETVNAAFTSVFNRNNPGANTGNISGYVNGVLKSNATGVAMEAFSTQSLKAGTSASPSDFFKGDLLEIMRSSDTWTSVDIFKQHQNQQLYYGI